MANVLLTTAEAADRLNVSTRTLTRRVENGDIEPAQKLPGLRGAMLFDPADVEKLAAEIGAPA